MKKLMNYASLFFIGAAVVLSSCKKEEELTPDDPNAQLVTSTMTTTNMGNTLTANVVDTVSIGGGNIKLRLDVSGNNNLDEIFILKSEDNSLFEKVIVTSSITNSYGTFSAGSSNGPSLNIPNKSSFIVDIILPIRNNSSAVTDVYKIWITNGNGSFDKPAKNRDLGIALVTLKYVASASTATFGTATVTLGDQAAVPGSLLVTSGEVTAHLTEAYNDSPASSDLALCALNSAGDTKTNGSGILWLVSPDLRPGLGYITVANGGNEPNSGQNTTYIEATTGIDFTTVTAATLDGLTVSTSSKKVQIAVDGIYKFQTASGKKGLIKVNSITGTTNKSAEVTIKVQN